MHLLVVTQYFWPENFRINDLVSDFLKRGHQVTVLTGYPNYPEGKILPVFKADKDRFSRLEGARIIRCPLIPRGRNKITLFLNYLSFALSACLLGVWKLRNIKVDMIFVCQLSPATVGIPGILLKKIKKVPMILWVLDLWPETLEAVGVVRNQKVLQLIGKGIAWIYSKSDLILVQSQAFIDKISERGIPTTRISYFPSWAEEVFNELNPSPAKEVCAKPGAFKILFAGNVGDAQDFPNVLKAAVLIKARGLNVQWFIVGSGRRWNWLHAEIQRQGLADTVVLLGSFPVERMPSFYVHAQALLVSLKDEPIFSMTIPGKVQSYLAFGIPILGVLAGEGARIIKETGSGLISPPGNAEKLAETIGELVHLSQEERLKMGRNALAVSTTQFNRSKLLDGLEVKLRLLCS